MPSWPRCRLSSGSPRTTSTTIRALGDNTGSHGAQGRQPAALGRRAARPLGRSTTAWRRWPAAGGSSPAAIWPSGWRRELVRTHRRRAAVQLRRRALRDHRAAGLRRSTATAPVASAAPAPPRRPTGASSPASFRIARRRGAPAGLEARRRRGEVVLRRLRVGAVQPHPGRPPSRSAFASARLTAIPGSVPSSRQFVAYAAPWEPIPDDGLPRYPERPARHRRRAQTPARRSPPRRRRARPGPTRSRPTGPRRPSRRRRSATSRNGRSRRSARARRPRAPARVAPAGRSSPRTRSRITSSSQAA